MANNKRLIWVDQLKGFTFLLVILGHTTGILTQGNAHSYIYSFHMPLFLIATGLTLNINKVYEASFFSYVSKLFKRMVVPYVWLNLICMPLRYILYVYVKNVDANVEGFLKGIIVANTAIKNSPSPATPTYYVILLFFAQILLWFMIKLTKKNFGALAALSFVLLFIPLSTIKQSVIWHLNVVPVAVFFIVFGRFLMDFYLTHKEKIDSLKLQKLIPLCLVLFLFNFLSWKENGKISIHLNLYGSDFVLFFLSAVSAGIAIMLIIMRLPDTKVFSYVGQNTLFYLGIHAALQGFIEHYLKEWKNELWFILIESVALYLLLIPVVHLVNKYVPFLNGMPSRKEGLPIFICRYLCVVAAGIVPVFYFFKKFHGGMFFATDTIKAASIIGFFVLCIGVTFLFDKVFPFMYIKEKKKK